MKITLITKDKPPYSWSDTQFIQTAQQEGFLVEVHDILSEKDFHQQTFGNVIFWRSATIEGKARQKLTSYFEHKPFINLQIIKKSEIRNKFFQQNFLKKHSKLKTIPTFSFESKQELLSAFKEKKLSLPCIRKPAKGQKGIDIILIETLKQLIDQEETATYVYQPFIFNKGDYRVIVLDKKVLGCIKRLPINNSFITNISQGAKATTVEKNMEKRLSLIASKIAKIFNLDFCGIDLIFDEKEKNIKFLEINSAPGWLQFESLTGINVAQELVSYSKKISKSFSKENTFN